MATVTGVTAARAQQIADQLITNATKSGTTLIFTKANGEIIQIPNAFAKVIDSYPVGSIYLSTSSANPSTYMGGGTWVRWGKGRVPVSLDEAQTEFDLVEETGGSKTHTLTVPQMPSHTHVIRNSATGGSATVGSDTQVAAPDNGLSGRFFTASEPVGSAVADSTGGGQAHNIMQPYIVCYMWKRTA